MHKCRTIPTTVLDYQGHFAPFEPLALIYNDILYALVYTDIFMHDRVAKLALPCGDNRVTKLVSELDTRIQSFPREAVR